ncbi:SGNH hydrolase [Pullulanibacillus camelliae]|uniref:SGNH hydrolase n=1 Tax=Pullulanibacillus camelliae TaxID=1707096 RepID=A0A8J2YK27_9BACL|nr:SGNH/GDSL hydrolase family protein [Pullulanibacillus camelliae]GGE49467.1 SGNH hydrolase [Pullulanibacillus camelliae]
MKYGKKRWIVFLLCCIALLFVILTAFGVKSKLPSKPGKWVAGWSAPPQPPSETGVSHDGFTNQTLRMIVHPNIGGDHVRLHFSNVFGTAPVTFQAVRVANDQGGAQTLLGSDRKVTFKGKAAITIPPGQTVTSDPVSIHVDSQRNLAVSIYVKKGTGPTTWHQHSMQTTYLSTSGNHASDKLGTAFKKKEQEWFWLDGVDVKADSGVKGAIAVVGSSIANGNHSTPDTNRRWIDDLGERLNSEQPGTWSIINAGISANQLLESSDANGEKPLNRLKRDVFSQTDISGVILHEGINDIRHHPDIDADQMIHEMKKIIRASHEHGLKIYGGTIVPYGGAKLYTDSGEKTREAVNHWIRTSGAFDGVIDFDKALRDPKDPKRYRPGYGWSDHFHPNDKGYQVMADAVNFSLFK